MERRIIMDRSLWVPLSDLHDEKWRKYQKITRMVARLYRNHLGWPYMSMNPMSREFSICGYTYDYKWDKTQTHRRIKVFSEKYYQIRKK